ncbi:MAG TPA: M20/M25/M40 family metallo-hydrolase [Vicinamibacterales bacterium]|nr:M20/M25/M40 family metallo-hydrolase [Vicinamibacterales bacterium]
MPQRVQRPQRTQRTVFAVSALVVAAAALHAQAPSTTKTHIETLASPRFEGRLAGSNGERLASEYIAAELQKIGAKPLPGKTDLRLPFEFTAGTRDGGSSIAVNGKDGGFSCGSVGNVAGGRTGRSAPARSGQSDTACVRPLSFSDNGDAEGGVVFAGYGIVVPEGQGFAYDSYATLDVKDKIVVVLRYFPEDAEAKTKQILARYADLRYKAMAARQHGAKAVIVVTGPRSPNAGELAPMTFDTALAGSGIVAVTITGDMANEVFAGTGKKLEDVQKSFDDANPHTAGFAIADMTISVRANVAREKKTGHNVVAYLPATDPVTTTAKPWVAIGAHYDHLGRGEAGNTLASKDDANKVHAGADDNASGTAAVLALAATLAKEKRHRNILVALWSGEELGLIGSNAFTTAPPVPLEQLAAYLNFDMVGRMQDNKLTIQAAGTSPAWARIIEQANVAAGFDLVVQDDPYQPTDVATFNAAAVPSLAFFTGTHADYHKPSDTADKIDYEDLDRVVGFAAAILRRIEQTDTPPQFTKVEQQMQSGGGRAGVRVFTGTIPDYSTEVKGLLLSGVIGGGPAEQAGLQKGDVIVEIAGQSIANIYDYTYALDVLKIGQPAKVIYLRGGERRETMLTPAARK